MEKFTKNNLQTAKQTIALLRHRSRCSVSEFARKASQTVQILKIAKILLKDYLNLYKLVQLILNQSNYKTKTFRLISI